MPLPSFLKSLAWEQWLYGLCRPSSELAQLLLQGSSPVMLIDPEKFNLNQSWNLVRLSFAIFAVAGVGQFWAYLKQGLPPMIAASKTTEQTETKPSGSVVTTKTSSEVVVQQQPKE